MALLRGLHSCVKLRGLRTQGASEQRQVAIALNAVKALLGVERAGRGPAADHFTRAPAGDVAALPDAKGAVGRQPLYRRVPPSVEMKYPARGGQVEPGAARLERQHEDRRRRAVFLLESRANLSRRALGHRAVQEQHLAPERCLQMALEDRAHLGELGKDQRALAGFDYLLQHLDQSRKRAQTFGNRGVVLEELRRMIADLLELGERRQHHPLRWMPLADSRSGIASSTTAA